jgi:osmotically-inducible protein OsmY/sporulation protein YlmC with PRC-barrel domain
MAEERMELRIGAPIFASDGEYGHLEQIVIDRPSSRVTGLVVRTNPLIDTVQLIPVEDITNATDDAIRVDLNTAQLARLPEVNGDEALDEALRASQTVRTTDGHTGTIIDLLTTPGGEIHHLVVDTGGLHRYEVILPVEAVSQVGMLTVMLRIDRTTLQSLPPYRMDQDLAEDVERALWNDPVTRELERYYLDAMVRDGIATLRGHVSTLTSKSRAEALVASVNGVLGVESHLVGDDQLRIRVAQAVSLDPPLNKEHIRVGTQHGIVILSGGVSSAEVRKMAEERAARVPQVRGVLNYLRAPGVERDEHALRAFQPQVGQEVFTTDVKSLGHVIRVIINPRNRLVVGIVVESKDDQPLVFPEVQIISRQIVLPAAVIKQVTTGGVFLSVPRLQTVWADTFDESDFNLPPADWVPPYPYCTGDILFNGIER